jgi:thiamine kinase-like enzyme
MKEIIDLVSSLSCFQNPTDIIPINGGITNVNVCVTNNNKKYVVRIGQDIPEHGVMRWNELALSKAAQSLGVSPAVVHYEPGILVLEFIDSQTFEEADVCKSKNLMRITSLVAKTHREIGQYLNTPILTFWPFQVNQSYMSRLESDGSPHMSKLADLKRQLELLQDAIGQVDLVIGHNDLLAANILDDGTQLWLIDWEYGGFNTPLFDLAGLAGNNGLSVSQEQKMLEQYFDKSWESYWRPYQAMKCTSLMRETLWSMVSEIYSEIEFDYGAYTSENLSRLSSAISEFQQI